MVMLLNYVIHHCDGDWRLLISNVKEVDFKKLAGETIHENKWYKLTVDDELTEDGLIVVRYIRVLRPYQSDRSVDVISVLDKLKSFCSKGDNEVL